MKTCFRSSSKIQEWKMSYDEYKNLHETEHVFSKKTESDYQE